MEPESTASLHRQRRRRRAGWGSVPGCFRQSARHRLRGSEHSLHTHWWMRNYFRNHGSSAGTRKVRRPCGSQDLCLPPTAFTAFGVFLGPPHHDARGFDEGLRRSKQFRQLQYSARKPGIVTCAHRSHWNHPLSPFAVIILKLPLQCSTDIEWGQARQVLSYASRPLRVTVVNRRLHSKPPARGQ